MPDRAPAPAVAALAFALCCADLECQGGWQDDGEPLICDFHKSMAARLVVLSEFADAVAHRGVTVAAPATCSMCDGRGWYEIPRGAHHDKVRCAQYNGSGRVAAPLGAAPGPWIVQHDVGDDWFVYREEPCRVVSKLSEREAPVVCDALNRLAVDGVRPVLPEGDRAARYHEIRLDADGEPDDIVLQCDSVQLERCDDGVWFFCAFRGGKRTALFLSKVGRNVVANVTENELNAPEVGLRAGRTETP